MSVSRRCLILSAFILACPWLASADDAVVRELLDKAIEKKGGEKALSKYIGSTSKVKGTLHLNGAPIAFTGEITSQAGIQQRISIMLSVDGQGIEFLSVVNRDEGWQKLIDNVSDMSMDQLTEAKAAAYSSWVSTLLPLKDKAFQLSSSGEIDIGGRKAIGVNVAREGRRTINLYFDKETFRLLRSEMTVRDSLTFRDQTEETNYSEFKEVDGVHHATRLTVKRDGQPHLEIEVENFKPAEKLDDSVFAKP